ncbi:trypsin-like peptidase [Oceanicella actignis]|nr:trypsin-like peptidase [Oceanicella actignis]
MKPSSRRQNELRRVLKRARAAPLGRGPAPEAMFESAAVGPRPPPVDEDFARASLEVAEAAMQADDGIDPADRAAALDAARRAYRRIAVEGAAPAGPDISALEAIQMFDGSRPAIALDGDEIPLDDPALGDWQGAAVIHGAEIARLAAAACLISSGDEALGSGFLVADGLIMTNRHVLEATAEETAGGWRFARETTAAFSSADQRAVTAVEMAGPKPIGIGIDFSRLDMALLRLAPRAAGLADPPPAPPTLDVSGAFGAPPALAMDARVCTVGFPIAIRDLSVEAQSLKLFRGKLGRKCWAPGLIDAMPVTMPTDRRKEWIFGYDASTLPGNSGSCVADLERAPRLALGLHIGGVTQAGNFAHSIAAAQNHLRAHGLRFDAGEPGG